VISSSEATGNPIAETELPPEFDIAEYRSANPDLHAFRDDELARHYRVYGESEGRRANGLWAREDFADLVSRESDALEIGPYYRPMLASPKTWFFDVLSRDQMLERARTEGVDGSGVPAIDFVSPTGDLGIVEPESFDAIFSSHALEHQPDLIGHLQGVHRLLRPGGRYFAIVPDKRYCFDHFNPESTVAEIVEAHIEKRRSHTLRSVLNLSVMTTHNDSVRHWNGDHGTFLESFEERVRSGLAEYRAADGGYVDVHAWYFTPSSIRPIVSALGAAQYVPLTIERVYPTLFHSLEFYIVFRKS
jgi:predicted SAM-dependent methyltransferase